MQENKKRMECLIFDTVVYEKMGVAVLLFSSATLSFGEVSLFVRKAFVLY